MEFWSQTVLCADIVKVTQLFKSRLFLNLLILKIQNSVHERFIIGPATETRVTLVNYKMQEGSVGVGVSINSLFPRLQGVFTKSH